MIKGPLFGFIVALIIVLAILALIYVSDIAIRALENTNREIAKTLEVEETTEYSKRADQVVASLAIILVAAILFIIAVLTIHLKTR